MRPVLQLMERVAPSDANVLITGEHGTGKEVVAHWLHAASPRAARPLVAVNIGGLSEGVFESEMFGHVKGAFTDARADRIGRFELADGGTLLLDEIAHISRCASRPSCSACSQTGEVERVGRSRARQSTCASLSATNADLAAEVAAGRFREDLLFRLNTIEIHLPPLRERREDIRAARRALPRAPRGALPEAARRLRARGAAGAARATSWPGNVRELDHTIERAVLLAQGDPVRAARSRAPRPAAPRRRASRTCRSRRSSAC